VRGVIVSGNGRSIKLKYSVMAGLVPAIVFYAARLQRRGCPAQGRA
jgi:hypothetical protein